MNPLEIRANVLAALRSGLSAGAAGAWKDLAGDRLGQVAFLTRTSDLPTARVALRGSPLATRSVDLEPESTSGSSGLRSRTARCPSRSPTNCLRGRRRLGLLASGLRRGPIGLPCRITRAGRSRRDGGLGRPRPRRPTDAEFVAALLRREFSRGESRSRSHVMPVMRFSGNSPGIRFRAGLPNPLGSSSRRPDGTFVVEHDREDLTRHAFDQAPSVDRPGLIRRTLARH